MPEKLIAFLKSLGFWLVPIVLGGLFIYYIVLGLALYQRVDDNPDFTAKDPTQGGSAAVDIASSLIDREVNVHEWMPNEPWFTPGSWLTRTPAYQEGIVMALRRFSMAMIDHLARQRGTSQIDPDLQAAQASLNFYTDRWVPSGVDVMTPSSEKEYRKARKALLDFNKRLASGQALFEKRADNLQSTLESFAAEIGSQSAVIEDHIRKDGGGILEFKSNEIYFSAKGRLYAYYLLLRELGHDYEPIIKERGLTNVWDNMVQSLREASDLHPLIIFNGKGDSQFMPCHLCGLGFELMRARTQLYECSNILQR